MIINGSQTYVAGPMSIADDRSMMGVETFGEIVANVMGSRQEFFRKLLDPKRDYASECGHVSGYIDPHSYQELYDFEALANRVVEVLPRESWQVQPSVYEIEGPRRTMFEDAWDAIGRGLRGGGWHQEEEGSAVWEYMLRADILSGIGSYGIILLGLNDGRPLHEPVRGWGERNSLPSTREQIGEDGNGRPKFQWNRPNLNRRHPIWKLIRNQAEFREQPSLKLRYMRCFPESLAQVVQFESNPSSPRFGHPIMYMVTFNDPYEQHGGIGVPLATRNVHWTRVIHVADNLGSSEVFGIPRMRAVMRRLQDLVKLYGGSAEMFWRGAFPGLSVETHPQLGGQVKMDVPKIRGMLEDYQATLQRFLILSGMSAKTLAPQITDPTAQINVQVEAICIKLGIPIRIFKGSERGELASSQDDAAWNDRLKGRQKTYITPRIIAPFVDRLIALGVLPKPNAPRPAPRQAVQGRGGFTLRSRTGFSVWWPDLTSQTDQEKAQVALTRTQSMVAFQSGASNLMTEQDWLVGEMDYTEEEAAAILENKRQDQAGEMTDGPVPPTQPAPGLPGGRPNGNPQSGPNGSQPGNLPRGQVAPTTSRLSPRNFLRWFRS
jgi:hypothetical protein